jgi:hypothetical protein
MGQRAKRAARALFLAGVLCFAASPGGAANSVGNMNLVIINGSGGFDLYNGGSLESLLNSHQTTQAQYAYTLAPDTSGVTPSASYADMSKLLSEHHVEVWYFSSQQALFNLGTDQAGQLRSAVQQGAVVGFCGEGKTLSEQLGLQNQNRYADIPDGIYASYFANGTLDTVMEGYTLQTEGAELGESWAGVMSWAYNQLTASSVQAGGGARQDDMSSPWEALYNNQSNVSTGGLSSSISVSVYKLETQSKDSDWYRVDYIVQAATQNYKVGWFKDGLWSMSGFITNIDASATAYGSGMQLIEHVPSTTLSNTSKTFDIGGSLKLSKSPEVSGDVGYSVSFDCPDVTMYDYTSQADGKGSWSAVPSPPNLTWMPIYYTEPALAGRTSYAYEPSMIYKVPKGEPLELGVYNNTTFRNYNYYFLVINDERPTRTNSMTISVAE